MEDFQTRIKTLLQVINNWLSNENEHLLRAVERTAEEGYFSFKDVQFTLKALKNSLGKEALEQWVDRSGGSDTTDARGQNVLCLHAGNLPLVGFQDALAVLLSGARYTGKISRKDPYLLPSFLNEVKKTELWGNIDVQWSHRLDDFEGMPHDAILFAGSEQSVPDVKKAIQKYHLAKRDARYLIRTAHFSMAYFDQHKEGDIQDLAEAILRYGGKGCRSVAVVVSPFRLDEVHSALKKAMKNFWSENPQHLKPTPKLQQQYAYNEAVERDQLFMNNFLVQQGGLELDQDFICYWVEGDQDKVAELATIFGDRLQSIYVLDFTQNIWVMEQPAEPLHEAQEPPIYWKPDGTDTLKWLCR